MNKNKTYLHVAVALILGLLIGFGVQPENGLTVLGVRVLAVTIPTLYLWLTVNTSWCALLFLALLILTGAMTPTEVWAGSMGHFAVITMIVFSILNYALKETGVIDRAAAWFISRRIAKGRPLVFLGLFFLSNLIIGMFVDNLSLAIIYVGLAIALADKIGVKRGDPFYACLFIGILWCNVIISIASPIAHAPVLILIGMIETQLGITISYAKWLCVGVPFAAVMFLAMMAAVTVWRPNAKAFLDFDTASLKPEPLSRKGKITAGIFLLTVLAILLPEVGKVVFPGHFAFWSQIGVVVPAILAVCALCLITVDGKPVLDFRAACSTTGISSWLSGLLQPIFQGLSPFGTLALLAIAALVMTNFLSNVVTMVLFFNIGLALLSGSNLHLGAFAAVIGVAASMASLTPSACAPAPLIFGPGHVTVRGVLKANLVFLVLSLAACLVVVYPLASAVFG